MVTLLLPAVCVSQRRTLKTTPKRRVGRLKVWAQATAWVCGHKLVLFWTYILAATYRGVQK